MERRQLEDLLVSQSFSHLSLLSPTPFPDQSPAFHGGPAVAWPVVIDCLTAHYVWLWVCMRVSATTPRKCHCPLTSIFAHFPAHFPAISPTSTASTGRKLQDAIKSANKTASGRCVGVRWSRGDRWPSGKSGGKMRKTRRWKAAVQLSKQKSAEQNEFLNKLSFYVQRSLDRLKMLNFLARSSAFPTGLTFWLNR